MAIPFQDPLVILVGIAPDFWNAEYGCVPLVWHCRFSVTAIYPVSRATVNEYQAPGGGSLLAIIHTSAGLCSRRGVPVTAPHPPRRPWHASGLRPTPDLRIADCGLRTNLGWREHNIMKSLTQSARMTRF